MYRNKLISFCVFLVVFSLETNATSLFNENKFKAITSDHTALRVGDTLTILIFENAQARSSAGNSSDSNFALSASGSSPQGRWPFGIDVAAGESGDAVIKRNGFVQAQITAVVIEQDDSGNLLVKGRQEITIDDELQSIELTGQVRPADISADNSVPSFRLYDAKIKIAGQGYVSDGQDSGIFYKVFSWLGLI
ncbi:flagellar basal body L-ring protein FlgH [Rheinheimera aquimaris]|jgi:flagellar L-ring protein precursor FlgH|uniref:flagellar basal body L-ring protein FlgH n=1 Tax=Rheinheimera aquimaris TaxID=412437 RepID=UPI001416F290|nr:flagellar basal body L-ring protein FlgH [Rheinheimera aquimaris]|tara:strand:+ start:8201 stop:8779 length:579 start_codon:yes stop_codon:yes gene_type:complete